MTPAFNFCDECNQSFAYIHTICLYCHRQLRHIEGEKPTLPHIPLDIPKEHLNIEHIRKVCREYKHKPLETPTYFTPYQEAKKVHLVYVSLNGPWFYINGERQLRFKTRGNNRQDLLNALSMYDVDYWESDFEQVTRDMAGQLKAQAEAKNRPLKLEAIA